MSLLLWVWRKLIRADAEADRAWIGSMMEMGIMTTQEGEAMLGMPRKKQQQAIERFLHPERTVETP